MTPRGADVLVLGGEPAALACAARLLQSGARVAHILPLPWGLLGASRDIGLAYPELGEPFERLEHSLGREIARELHDWGKTGIDLLTQACESWEGWRRGSRLSVMRNEAEAALVGTDALDRQRLGDEVRLMSGAAASNYAPLEELHQASFETHAAAFVPVALSQYLAQQLSQHPNYRAFELVADGPWKACRAQSETGGGGVEVRWGETEAVRGELLVVAAGFETTRLLGRFAEVLVPLLGQAFRSEPLRESTRSSVVGLTASWGYERYRFDSDRRLLGCGIDPGAGERYEEPVVLDKVQAALWKRANGLFSDLHRSGEDGTLRWGVPFTTTCDGLPLLGPLPGEPRIHVVAGFSTSAWSRGYAAGSKVADALTKEGFHSALLQRCNTRRFV